MLSLIRIAVRNVLRNTRRSLITMAAVVIGAAVIVFFRGFLNGLQKGLVDAVTNGLTGQIQMYREGYLSSTDAFPLNLAVDFNGDVRGILASDDRVTAYSGRLMFAGQLSNGRSTTLIVGQGIDPENDYKVVPDASSDLLLKAGTGLPAGKDDAAIISEKLADAMELGVGDRIVVVAATQAGSFDTVDLEVVGISKVGSQITGYESKTVQLPLPTVQRLLGMPDQVTEVIVSVKSFDIIDEVTESLAAAAATKPELKLTVSNWTTRAAFFVDVINIQNMVLNIVTAVLLLVIVTGIVNTMLMSVFERVREIGTMMAIGVKRNKILAMFVVESAALGVLGAFAGLVIGSAIVLVLGQIGFPISPASSPRAILLYPFIRLDYLVFVLCLAMGSSLIAAIYPAWHAAQLKPVDALRAN